MNYTNESALIRKLLVEMYMSTGEESWLNDETNGDPADIPQPFLLELASELLDLRGGTRPKIEASDYHINGSNDALKAEAAEKNGLSRTRDSCKIEDV